MKNKNNISIILLAPATIVIIIFIFLPIFLSFYYSFTNATLSGKFAINYKFIGFSNFWNALTNLRFYTSMYNTLVFLFGSILGQQVLGLVIALLMRHKNPIIRRTVGSTILSGWVCPEIVAAFAWLAFFNQQGTISVISKLLYLPEVSWLFEFSMFSIIIVNIWRGTAFSMLVFQSAFDSISESIEEAASIDGANSFQRFILVIIPSIKDIFITNTVLITLQTLGIFGLIYALTGGGPGMKTQTLPIFIYNEAFVGYQIGYGAAISVFLLIIGAILSISYIRLFRSSI